MREIVAADIGGTNARFARARLDAEGHVVLGEAYRYRTDDFPDLARCWRAYRADAGPDLPRHLSVAVAGAVRDGAVRFTNSSWTIRLEGLAGELGLEEVNLVNDFAAVAHAVARLPRDRLALLFGPDTPLPENGTVTILGPGTGLGVAAISFAHGKARILPTEGGHAGFAPVDEMELRILEVLREEYGRVSVERVVSGPGLNNLYRALRQIAGEPVVPLDDAVLWDAALSGTDPTARAALARLCACYGTAAGDLALAHGPHHVVLAGGLAARMRGFLVGESEFYQRFTDKGRYGSLMRSIPVRHASHPEIGLWGAAAAWFFRER